MCGTVTGEHLQKQGGKHPRHTQWQRATLRTSEQVAAYWDRQGLANVGIATGTPSGVWVLDIDPRHGGDVALAGLVDEHGQLPRTRTVSTGSGGTHFYWVMPPGVDVRNSAGRVGRGLDVRGTGGQAVAPPSVSGAGPYDLVDDREPVRAPGWLEALVTSAPEPDRPTTTTSGTVALPSSDHEKRRALAYASRVIGEEATGLALASPGTRNEAAFRAACRLWEIVNAGWATEDAVFEAYLGAAQCADRADDTFPASEAHAVWRKACSRVGGAAATLPPDQLAPEVVALAEPPPVSRGTGLEDELLSLDELAERPAPEPLIDGILDLGTSAWLIGKPGSYKSFVAIDIAAHVATGRSWQGRRTRAGTVIYILGEGQAGAALRARAWKSRYGPAGQLLFLPRPVRVADPAAWSALVALCAHRKPVLIALDTQHRMTAGLDENSAKEMGIYIDAVDLLRQATGACVLTIHHIGRNGTDARGSSAIDGAQDTELRVERCDEQPLAARLVLDKQKDAADGEAINLQLDVVDLGTDPTTGRPLSSLVVADPPASGGFVEPSPTPEQVRAVGQEEVTARLAALVAEAYTAGNGGTEGEIKAAYKALYGTPPYRMQLGRAWQRLLDERVVGRVAGTSHYRYIAVDDRPAPGEEPILLPRADA